MTLITRHIPKTDQYPGLIAHRIDDDHEIVVIGDGPEAEAVLERAVIAKRAESVA